MYTGLVHVGTCFLAYICTHKEQADDENRTVRALEMFVKIPCSQNTSTGLRTTPIQANAVRIYRYPGSHLTGVHRGIGVGGFPIKWGGNAAAECRCHRRQTERKHGSKTPQARWDATGRRIPRRASHILFHAGFPAPYGAPVRAFDHRIRVQEGISSARVCVRLGGRARPCRM
jgi:hypothetical protein